MLVLGIETSCDETGIALFDTQAGLLADVLHSQIAMHARFGGVVPELAARDHSKRLLPLLAECVTRAHRSIHDIDGVAYTAGPGLIGALLVGGAFARSFAFARDVPVVAVHHMEAHLLAPMLATDKPEYPFVALLVSGGHTQLVDVAAPGTYRLLGESLDDAAGEAFDKSAKLLGLGYPGGPAIAQAAVGGNERRFKLPRPMLDHDTLDFSFSGLKTAVLHQRARIDLANPTDVADLAASFQQAVVDTLVGKCLAALRKTNRARLVIAGGVSANVRLRAALNETMPAMGARLFCPPLHLCTDNGAMIAYAGALKLAAGEWDELRVQARPRWPLAAR